MRFSDYINDRKTVLLVCFAGGLFFTALLMFFGIGMSELFLLWSCFIVLLLSTILSGYLHQRKRIQALLCVSDSLEKKYLIAEVADRPDNTLEQVYFGLMKTALKAMTDEVAKSRRLNSEYRDFIEQWVHEIKVPLTGIQLICHNSKNDTTRKILTQTELIGQDIERVLFYARLGSAEKDYFIKEISLRECVLETIEKNRQFLIQNGVCVHSENVSDTVHSDGKWLCFILNQIIFNSIKYRGLRSPVLYLESRAAENYISLSITDNGIGIKESELHRVFDKGFVGSNGRSGNNATGIGLYLCAQLCARLGIGIDIESEVNESTTVILYFPENSHLKI